MASYVCLIQFSDQGIRNIQDTMKRGDAAIAQAEKMGMYRQPLDNVRNGLAIDLQVGGKIPAEVRHSDHNETATWLSRGVGQRELQRR